MPSLKAGPARLPSGPSSPPPRGSEYAELSRQVRQAGLLERRPWYYAWKITFTVLLLAAGWAAFALIGDSWWQLAVAVFLAVVFTQVGFLGHDAGHRQIFRSRQANYSSASCRQPGSARRLVVSSTTATTPIRTPKARTPISRSARWPSASPSRGPRGARPGWCSASRPTCSSRCCCWKRPACTWPASARWPAGPPGRGTSDRGTSHHWAWEAGLLTVHAAGYLTAVFLVLSPVRALVFIAVQQGLFGVYLGSSFAPNHKGMPILDPADRTGFLRLAGPHLPQRPWRLADRLRAGWAELPDRAPPVPVHAAAQPPPLPGSGPRLLPAARPRLLPDQPDRLLRPGSAPPEQRRQVGPAAANPGSLTPTATGRAPA